MTTNKFLEVFFAYLNFQFNLSYIVFEKEILVKEESRPRSNGKSWSFSPDFVVKKGRFKFYKLT